MVMGGQAVLVHGEPRLTRDIDVTLGLTTDNIAAVLAAVGSVGLKVLVDSPEAFVRNTWVLPWRRCPERTGTKVLSRTGRVPRGYAHPAVDDRPALAARGWT
jgi:hypothetical protein